MKYFTPELLSRIRSVDEEVSERAHADWERAIRRCHRRWQKIKAAFPGAVQRFEEESVCLHGAQVLRMGRAGQTFVMVMEKEPPTPDLILLTFTLDGEPKTDTIAPAGARVTDFVTWMYEEWDLDRSKGCQLEVLLSNGWLVKLRFRDFHYLIVPQVFPAVDGRVATAPAAPVPQSA